MGLGIRVASAADAVAVAEFFCSVYEAQHGVGSAADLSMGVRTVEVLFPEGDAAPMVFVYESAESIQGVAAVHAPNEVGESDLLTVQVYDTVQGRGIGQTLLRRIIEQCDSWESKQLAVTVPVSDVRARGFLRREGFTADAGALEASSNSQDASVRYAVTFAG